jgi:hypothetical protein
LNWPLNFRDGSGRIRRVEAVVEMIENLQEAGADAGA